MIELEHLKIIILNTILLSLVSITSNAQEIEYITSINNKEIENIKTLKIKSRTEWGYNYKFGELDTAGKKIRHFEYNKYGKELEINLNDSIGAILTKIVNKYDTNGLLLERQFYNRNTLQVKISNKYDDEGKIIESTNYEYDIKVNRVTKYKYNNKNYFSEIFVYLPNGVMDEKLIYKYNNEDQKIECLEFSSDGKISNKRKYKYDLKGNLIEQISFDRNGEIFDKIAHKYDDNGNKLESIWYDGKNKMVLLNVFKYDNKNTLIESISYSSINEPEYVVKYVYEYFER
jgi:hypothetical protein